MILFATDASRLSKPKVYSTRLIFTWAMLRSELSLDTFSFRSIKPSLNASAPLGIDCLHGELECIGNAHQICLQEHLDTATFYANIACQNYENFPGDIGKLALTRRCAETNKVDWWKSGVGQCIQGKKAEHDDGKKAAEKGKVGKEARRLLLDNVKNTLARGEKSTCVIEIATSKKQQRRRCKVDHGVWTGCDVSQYTLGGIQLISQDGHTATDFVRVIEEEWEALQ